MQTTRPSRRPALSARRRALALASVLALGAAGTLAGAVLAKDGFRPRVPDLPRAAADTVVLFGPRVFDAGRGQGALHVERFGATPAGGRGHVLRLARGGATHATLSLNGRTLFDGPLAVGVPVLEFPVALAELNTLQATVTGEPGSGVTVTVLETADLTFIVWGRKRFDRSTGSPVVQTERFTVSATAGAPFALRVENGTADGASRVSSARVRVNGVEVMGPSHLNQNVFTLALPAALRAGENVVEVSLAGAPGSFLTLWLTATDVTAPVIEIATPAAGRVTRDTELEVSGTVRDETATRVTVNETEASRVGDVFRATVPLSVEGENTITVSAVDAAGLRADSVRTVIRDTEAPVVILTAPTDGSVTRDSVAAVSGVATDRTLESVNVNGIPVTPDAGGAFQAQVPLSEGANFVSVTAMDRAGNTTTSSRQVTRDTNAPMVTIVEPEEGAITEAEEITVRGVVQDATPVVLSVGTRAVAVGPHGAFEVTVPLAEGENEIVLKATDAAGNSATATRRVTRQGEETPPAPPVEPGVVTNLYESVQFLYTGENPVQTGVAPGAINPIRISVLRGRVIDREGRPLPGVSVSIQDHPQYGRSTSRSDGWYDIVVNGGDRVLVNLEREGYLPSQRHVTAEWQEFASVPEVVLVQLDPQVTRVDLSADSLQVARGSVQTDADGSRQATLIFEPGTGAQMLMADSSLVPLTTLDVRATEYTVGEGGPSAMPGPLPATSAYTYAVELSVDSALSAGALGVRFTQPVELYVENFLGFPTGMPVPVATYDCIRCGAWVPDDDGRTIRILSVAGGIALVDADGDGAADSDAQLNAIGLDPAERAKLATLYQDGASLWRVRMRHFSPIDLNYPNGPPDDAENPDDDAEEEQNDQDKDCKGRGSIIGCTNRTLGERIALAGTPLSLSYTTARVPGRIANAIRIPLTDESVPASMRRVDLEITVAGRTFRQSFPAEPNQTHTFRWDGMDAYGRRLQGQHPVIVKVGYVYPFTYRVPASTARSFGLTCTGPANEPWSGGVDWQKCIIPTSVTSGARQEDVLWRSQRLMVGAGSEFDARALRLGGWTLSEHHAYDPAARVLHLGSGDRRSAEMMGPVITTVAGNGNYGSTGDGGPATQASIRTPDRVTVAADGTVYLPDASSYRVRKVAPDGRITTVAGNGLFGFSGDGGPATQARISDIYDVALGPDGAIYIADFSNHRVRRVGTDGIITTVAGNGVNGWSGDGGPARQAAIGYPWGLAVGPDCSIYIASDWNVIRKVSPDGTITTIAGNGTWGYSGDGGPARLAQIDYPDGVALGPDGSVYIEDINNGAIRRVSPDGIISTFAGGGGFGNGGMFSVSATADAPAEPAQRPGVEERAERKRKAQSAGEFDVTEEGADPALSPGAGGGVSTLAAAREMETAASPGDGGPATAVWLSIPYAVSVARDGTAYISESGANRVRQVAPDGVITTVTGQNSVYGFRGDGGPAAAAWLRGPWGVTVAPDGSLYISDTSNRRVRRIAPPMPGFSATDVTVASEDGREVYQFSATGRHLRTLHAQTGAVRWTFDYDSAGRLVRMTDGNGRATRVERDGAGNPSAVVGPYGDRSVLTLGPDGYLASVANPAGETVRMAYASGGLLSAYTDGAGNTYRFEYDPAGMLAADIDPAGGAKRLTRDEPAADGMMGLAAVGTVTTSTFTSAEGRTTTYASEEFETGGRRVVRTAADGTQTVTTVAADGTVTIQAANGMVTSLVNGPDPRFGMQAPVPQLITVTSPEGRVLTTQRVRHVRLADPANPLTLLSQTDSVRVNGRLYVSTFDAATGEYVQTSPAGRQRRFRTDAQGRPVAILASGLATVQYEYDADGRVARATQGDRAWTYLYGTDGRLSGVTDPLGRTAGYTYDAAGRLSLQTLPGGATIGFGYDSAGQLRSITPPGRPAHGFRFGATGWMAGYTPAADSVGTAYEYDRDGLPRRVLHPDGTELALEHDAGGHLVRIAAPGVEVRYGFDPVTGMLTSASAPGSTLSLEYDGLLPRAQRWRGEVSGDVTFEYDDLLRVRSQGVGGTAAIDYRYDPDGLLTGAGALAMDRRADNGLLSGTRLGTVSTALAYDGFGNVSVLAAGSGAGSVYRAEYGRDALGRITRLTETTAAGTAVYGYEYDTVGRLAKVTRDDAPVAVYEYDANGNRLRVTGPAGVVAGSYDAQDRLLEYGGAAYTYGATGELRSVVAVGDTTRFEYDALGNLRGVGLPAGTRVEYVVDASHRRIGKKVDGVLVQGFLYGGRFAPVAELDGAGNVVSRFVYGTRPNVPDYMVRGGRTLRIVADHLGSVRAVVDAATSEVVQRIDYDAFGQVILDTNPGFQPFGFAGGLTDRHTGLVRFGERDYDPRTGRWTARDPVLFNGGSSNLYAYALEDPVNLIDTSGRQALAGALPLAGGAAAADGPLPVGDIIAGGILITAGIIDLVHWMNSDDATADEGGDYCPVPLPDGELGPDNLPPAEDWEWRGPRDKGSAHNPNTGESIRPDLNHGPPIGPHYDYKDPSGRWWRVDPQTGKMTPK